MMFDKACSGPTAIAKPAVPKIISRRSAGSSGRRSSPRALLTAQEISYLDAALMAAYRMHDELRAEIAAASFIARPPIPAVLSESLVGYSAPWLFGDGCVATFGGTRADLVV